MKRLAYAAFLLMLIIVFSSISWGKYSGGTGEPNDPYLIATPNDLNSIGLDSNDWDKHFKMTADINMSSIMGNQFNIIGDSNVPFSGVFDGQGRTIVNFTCVDSNEDYAGIFGIVVDGKLYNINLLNAVVDASPYGDYVGSLVGRMTGGQIINCSSRNVFVSGGTYVGGLIGYGDEVDIMQDNFVSGFVLGSGDDCGGMVGLCVDTELIGCDVQADVQGYNYVGGLIGRSMLHGGLTSQRNSFTGSVQGVAYVGGLAGEFGINYQFFVKSFARGQVTGDYGVGGFAGVVHIHNAGEINFIDCYSSCDVNGVDNVGGLIGFVYSNGFIGPTYGEAVNCFMAGRVTGTGSGVGPVFGELYRAYLFDAVFWDKTVNPDFSIQDDPPSIIPATTTELEKRQTFLDAGWDMIEVWDIGENQTYPFLRTHLPSDINKDGETDFYDLAILAEHWLSK